ncbi:dihydrolipoyl dehydrogenase [Aquiluna sp. KACHI24]|uniref:dihydrolipoyl dehydrogenase n=1 Tax=Aquiluna sp. KACHI24 TaxID=2968831 RepID=UPI00220F610B|nr:dihydrolipoyl dehydrogenase [Aquiluna sp. KACHI24]BDQ00359.1 dihydrolipoyl dehydrogenase [Aquiluna sp. KACHI24]
MANHEFDLVILGSGSGGYAAALRAAQLGMTVALIERDKLGGTCLHRGCIPTKALLHSAEVADVTKEAAHFGVNATFQSIDMTAVNRYRDSIIDKLYKGLTGLVSSKNITFVTGEGRLTGPKTVTVGAESYTGKNVVLATGSVTKTLGIEIGGRVITSDQALQMDWIPNKVAILGGGVIGVEFASIWRSFGAEVVIIEGFDRLVPNEDPSMSKGLERAYRKRGIEFKLGNKFKSVTQSETAVTIELENGEQISADLLLVAVGRAPNATGFGYEEQGVAMDRGFVLTNERLATNLPGVYAVGDIVPGLQLAHRGFMQGIFVAEEIAGLNPIVVNEWGIPRVTYCEPEIASVGLTEAQAKEKFGADSISTYEYNLAGNGKSNILGTAGVIKLIRQVNGPVVGFHMIGSRAGEQVGEAQLIVNWEAYPEDVAPLIHAHPTMNEAIGEAHLALAGKPLHAHA